MEDQIRQQCGPTLPGALTSPQSSSTAATATVSSSHALGKSSISPSRSSSKHLVNGGEKLRDADTNAALAQALAKCKGVLPGVIEGLMEGAHRDAAESSHAEDSPDLSSSISGWLQSFNVPFQNNSQVSDQKISKDRIVIC